MKDDGQKSSKFDEAASKFRNLTSGALKVSLVIIFAVSAWRLAMSDVNVDLSKFDFSDLLAMILALFAMGMSVAFYFKSTDSSNQFYDNIYNFTQKTSEILGRIEERFGERLRHLDEGYGRIQSHFEGGLGNSDEIEKKVEETKGKEEEEKKKIEETNAAMAKILDELADRADLQQQEREDFYEKMQTLEHEKDVAQDRLREMEEERNRMREQLEKIDHDLLGAENELMNPILFELSHHPEIHRLVVRDSPSIQYNKVFDRFLEQFPRHYAQELVKAGIINEEGKITPAGIMVIKSIVRRELGIFR